MSSKVDAVTGLPQFVIAYTVEEGGMWRYLSCDGEINRNFEFNKLYARQDVLALRVFEMTEAHRRRIVMAWDQEA